MLKWNTDWSFVCWEILNISPSSHSLYNNTTNINKWCHSHPFNCALSIIHCRNTEAAYKHGCAATVSTHGLQLYSHWWKKREAHRGGKMSLLQDEQKERAVPFSQLNERTRWQKKEAWTAFLISIPKCLSGGWWGDVEGGGGVLIQMNESESQKLSSMTKKTYSK